LILGFFLWSMLLCLCSLLIEIAFKHGVMRKETQLVKFVYRYRWSFEFLVKCYILFLCVFFLEMLNYFWFYWKCLFVSPKDITCFHFNFNMLGTWVQNNNFIITTLKYNIN
jgi:hypothetical protein